eukprot:1925464-Amphidinium_carterae.5
MDRKSRSRQRHSSAGEANGRRREATVPKSVVPEAEVPRMALDADGKDSLLALCSPYQNVACAWTETAVCAEVLMTVSSLVHSTFFSLSPVRSSCPSSRVLHKFESRVGNDIQLKAGSSFEGSEKESAVQQQQQQPQTRSSCGIASAPRCATAQALHLTAYQIARIGEKNGGRFDHARQTRCGTSARA